MELYTALSPPKGEGVGVGLLVNSSLLSHAGGVSKWGPIYFI